MTKGFNIRINNTMYYVKCNYGTQRKCKDNYGLLLDFTVKDVTHNKYLSGGELKGTYIEEKISDYIVNCINGQRSCYYDFNGENENGNVILNLGE